MNYKADDFYRQLEFNAVNRLETLKKGKIQIEEENEKTNRENERIKEENRRKQFEYSNKLADYYVQLAMLASEALMNSLDDKLEFDIRLISLDISQYLSLDKANGIEIKYDDSTVTIAILYKFYFYPDNGFDPTGVFHVHSFDTINEILKTNNFDIIVSLLQSDRFTDLKDESCIYIKYKDSFLKKNGMHLPNKIKRLSKIEYN